VQLKLRFSDFRTITRAKSLDEPTNITAELWQAAARLLDDGLKSSLQPIRLLGMGVSGLDGTGQAQGQLFDGAGRAQQGRLDEVTDRIRDRYGRGAVQRGSSLKREGHD
jgi:DNA polymerase-4